MAQSSAWKFEVSCLWVHLGGILRYQGEGLACFKSAINDHENTASLIHQNSCYFHLFLEASTGVGPVSNLESTSKVETKQKKSGHEALLQIKKTRPLATRDARCSEMFNNVPTEIKQIRTLQDFSAPIWDITRISYMGWLEKFWEIMRLFSGTSTNFLPNFGRRCSSQRTRPNRPTIIFYHNYGRVRCATPAFNLYGACALQQPVSPAVIA